MNVTQAPTIRLIQLGIGRAIMLLEFHAWHAMGTLWAHGGCLVGVWWAVPPIGLEEGIYAKNQPRTKLQVLVPKVHKFTANPQPNPQQFHPKVRHVDPNYGKVKPKFARRPLSAGRAPIRCPVHKCAFGKISYCADLEEAQPEGATRKSVAKRTITISGCCTS